MGAYTARIVVCFFSLILYSSAVSGQDAETMLVTAARTPQRAAESGISLSIIDAQELYRRQSASVADILRNVPGFAVSRSGGFGSTVQLRVRGAEANQVLVLIDGIEANDPAQGSEFNFAHLLNQGIERIEVIRGPQSALWGSDALAGVVNIITPRGAGRFHASGFAEQGTAATRWFGGGLGGASDRLQFRFDGSFLESGGYNISRAGDEDDGYENGTLTLRAGIDASPALAIEMVARHTQARNEFDDIDFVATGLPVDSDLETETVQDLGRAEAKWSALGGRLEQVVSGSFTGTDNDNFRDGRETESTRGRKRRAAYQANWLLDGASPGNSSHVLSVAAEYETEEFSQRGPVTPFGDPNQDREVDATALAGEYRWRVESLPSLMVSVRHDMNSDFADATVWRVNSAWVPRRMPGTRLHAAWGEGSKNPTFSERFGFFADSQVPFFGNPDLSPERSRGWEAGAEQRFFGDSAGLSATYFQERLHGEIDGFVFDPGRAAFTAVNVKGSSRRQGVEVSVSLDWSPDTQIEGMATWLEATQPDATGARIEEVRRPRVSAALNANHAFAAGRGNVNLNFTYSGAQTDTFFPPFPRPPEQVRLDSFVLVAIAGSYRVNETLSLVARVENLLDEEYEEVLGFRGAGLSAYAGIRLGLQP